MQSAILEAYKQSKSSPNEALRKEYGKYYSRMHDDIQKYSHELNSVFLRTIQVDEGGGVKIINVPWGLIGIEGDSLDSDKLVSNLIKTMNGVKPSDVNAFDPFVQLQRNAGIPEVDVVLPPAYFKSCVLDEAATNIENHEIYLNFNNWPVGMMGDGCFVNNAANDKLTDRFGLVTPAARCSTHAADGNIKRMSNSAVS